VSQLWIPGAEGPHDDFVARIHRQIGRFAQERGISQAAVEIELRDGWRFVVDALLPEPGYGFVTTELSLSPTAALVTALFWPMRRSRRVVYSPATHK
jgi:hypothetical protein